MAQNPYNLLNLSCWNCSSSLPQETTTAPRLTAFLPKDDAIILSVVCAVASVIGTFGNSLVLFAVLKNENLRNIPDLFITSLAFSDITVCALFLPMSINYFMQGVSAGGQDDVIFFSARSFFGYTSMVASATNIFAVTVDRVVAIRFPFKYMAAMTKRRALVGIVAVWIVSVAFGFLYAPMLVSNTYIASYSCILLFTTMIMYLYIFIVAKRQENRIHQGTASDGSVAEKKVAKTIFTVVGIYALCWLPMLLLPAIANPSTNLAQVGRGHHWVQTLLACNSAVNPYIYCMRSMKYRTAFGQLLRLESCVNPVDSTQ